jgi:transcriptional regulator with XRE-family HTH domain
MLFNSLSIEPQIDGDKLKQTRVDKNLSVTELARACVLAPKHIIQLENGESSNFFSAHHKVQVAKKVASYLGLEDHEYLNSSTK